MFALVLPEVDDRSRNPRAWHQPGGYNYLSNVDAMLFFSDWEWSRASATPQRKGCPHKSLIVLPPLRHSASKHEALRTSAHQYLGGQRNHTLEI